MDNFKILLQSALDKVASKANINSDIGRLQKQIDKLKIKAELDPASLKSLMKQIESTSRQKTTSVNKAPSIASQIFNTKDLDSQGKVYFTKVNNTIEKMSRQVKTKFTNLGFKDIDISGIETANGKVKEFVVTASTAEGIVKRLRFERQKLQGDGKAQAGFVQTDNIRVIDKTADAIARLNKEKEKTALKDSDIQYNIDTSAYTSKIESIRRQYSKWGNSADEVNLKLKELDASYAAMISAPPGDERIQKEKEFQKALETTRNTQKMSSQPINEIDRAIFNHQLDEWKRVNSNAKEFHSRIDQIKAALATVDDTDGLRNLTKQWKELDAAAAASGVKGKSPFDTLTSAGKKFAEWIGPSTIVMSTINYIREMARNVVLLDTNLTELAKVSDATGSRLQESFTKSTSTAKELGATISDTISATADWSRLGYSMDQSEELARIAILYKNVGDGIDIDTANKSLVSTLQGFQLDAEEAIKIIDKFNEVANNFPIDTAGVGEALQRSAASFHAANTDLSKSIALITGTNAVVQDPDSVGTMWKTVSMRIRGAKSELEDAGLETEGMVETTSDLQDLIKDMTGFDILEDEDTFKDIYEIIVGIGHEWKNLTDIEQASLLETLAGKRQGNALSAALNNITMIEDAYKTAENSAGSAMAEQAKYEQSIQYSLNRLSASFEQFSSTVMGSGLLKGLTDLGTVGVNALNGFVKAATPLGTIGAISGGILGGKGLGGALLFKAA